MKYLHNTLLLLILVSLLNGCLGLAPKPTLPGESKPLVTAVPFEVSPLKKTKTFASAEVIRRFSESKNLTYLMGPGDVLSIKVWRRPELNNEAMVVSPDGTISVARIGLISVNI